jgi:hypothetical protein
MVRAVYRLVVVPPLAHRCQLWHKATMTGEFKIGVFTAFIAASALLGACKRVAPADEGATNVVVQEPAPQVAVPKPSPPLDREGLIVAALHAGSAAILGQDDRTAQAQFKGRKFALAMRFGCVADTPGRKGGWTYDAKTGVLRVQLKPDFDQEGALAKALVDEGFESIAGFTIRQPWLLQTGCPVGAVPIAADPPQQLSIVQLLTEQDSRVQRLSAKYDIVKEVEAAEVPRKGLDLVVEGRLELLEDGRAIHCTPAVSPPNCIISAKFDRISVVEPQTRDLLAEWGFH